MWAILGFTPEAALEGLGLTLCGPGVEVVQLFGLQGLWQHQVLSGVSGEGSRKYSALEGYGNQYWPIRANILAWRIPSLTEKPGRPQSTGSQRVGWDGSDPARINTSFFLPVAALPQWELGVKVVQLLDSQGPRWHQACGGTDSLHGRSSGSVFRSSCSWSSEVLFGKSFSVALPVQALGGILCLGSFSVVWHHQTHTEAPRTGVLLWKSAHQAL